MCKIDGCDKPPVALGFCSTHYRRLRRHGDASIVRKPGRKPDTMAIAVDSQNVVSDRSARTRAKYLRAMRLLRQVEAACPDAEGLCLRVLKKAIRPNGSINVSALLDYANGEFVTPFFNGDLG